MTWPPAYCLRRRTGCAAGRYALRPLRWDDREPIRQWRNDQIDVLRQAGPCPPRTRTATTSTSSRRRWTRSGHRQVLVAMTEDDALVGYGGVVHLSWSDRRGEVSFLTDTARLDEATFAADWRAYLDLLLPLARDVLRLHKLTTETYEVRTTLIPILEQHGFVLEGTLREHHLLDGRWVTSLAHGLILGD